MISCEISEDKTRNNAGPAGLHGHRQAVVAAEIADKIADAVADNFEGDILDKFTDYEAAKPLSGGVGGDGDGKELRQVGKIFFYKIDFIRWAHRHRQQPIPLQHVWGLVVGQG